MVKVLSEAEKMVKPTKKAEKVKVVAEIKLKKKN